MYKVATWIERMMCVLIVKKTIICLFSVVCLARVVFFYKISVKFINNYLF